MTTTKAEYIDRFYSRWQNEKENLEARVSAVAAKIGEQPKGEVNRADTSALMTLQSRLDVIRDYIHKVRGPRADYDAMQAIKQFIERDLIYYATGRHSEIAAEPEEYRAYMGIILDDVAVSLERIERAPE